MDRKLWDELARPFAPDEIRWRQQGKPSQNGRVQLVAYIDARAAMDRLDEVLSPGMWQDSYRPGADGGLICRIEVLIGDQWVGKEDGAENTQIEAVKGGMSDAFKRAAVKWGIGRYLYRLPSNWHKIEEGWANGRGVDVSGADKRHAGWVHFPQLPPWALPKGKRKETRSEAETRRAAHDPSWAGDQRHFFGKLADFDLQYDDLKAWLRSKSRPKPSAMTQEQRDKLLAYLVDNPEVCEAISNTDWS